MHKESHLLHFHNKLCLLIFANVVLQFFTPLQFFGGPPQLALVLWHQLQRRL